MYKPLKNNSIFLDPEPKSLHPSCLVVTSNQHTASLKMYHLKPMVVKLDSPVCAIVKDSNYVFISLCKSIGGGVHLRQVHVKMGHTYSILFDS